MTLLENLCLLANRQGGTIHQYINISDYDRLNTLYGSLPYPVTSKEQMNNLAKMKDITIKW